MVRKPRSGSVIGISGRLANVRLEAVMWAALQDVARRKGCSVDDLVADIDAGRKSQMLDAAVQNYLVEYYRESARRALENAKR